VLPISPARAGGSAAFNAPPSSRPPAAPPHRADLPRDTSSVSTHRVSAERQPATPANCRPPSRRGVRPVRRCSGHVLRAIAPGYSPRALSNTTQSNVINTYCTTPSLLSHGNTPWAIDASSSAVAPPQGQVTPLPVDCPTPSHDTTMPSLLSRGIPPRAIDASSSAAAPSQGQVAPFSVDHSAPSHARKFSSVLRAITRPAAPPYSGLSRLPSRPRLPIPPIAVPSATAGSPRPSSAPRPSTSSHAAPCSAAGSSPPTPPSPTPLATVSAASSPPPPSPPSPASPSLRAPAAAVLPVPLRSCCRRPLCGAVRCPRPRTVSWGLPLVSGVHSVPWRCASRPTPRSATRRTAPQGALAGNPRRRLPRLRAPRTAGPPAPEPCASVGTDLPPRPPRAAGAPSAATAPGPPTTPASGSAPTSTSSSIVSTARPPSPPSPLLLRP